jgi:aldehyde dehydrogenase (NAD+)
MKSAADCVTPVSLELGGKSPALVFPDADLEQAAADTAKVFWNAGQICFATTRVFVHTDVYNKFLDLLVAEAESMEVGPGKEDTDVGPLITEDARDRVVEYVEDARSCGAHIYTGGEIPREDGFYYEPTIIDGVSDDSPISCEEVFGPVITTYEFESESEAVWRANNTNYGLYATIWSNDVSRIHRLTRQVEASSVAVNQFPAVSNRVPIGGHKESGIGRVNGEQAMETYTETKSVLMNVDT